MASPDLAGLKAFLNIDTSVYDEELPSYLEAARSTIAQRCGPDEPTETVSEVEITCGTALLPVRPVIAVIDATNEAGAPIGLAHVRVRRRAGIVSGLAGYTGAATITYTAGYNPCPDDLELAIYIVAGHLWDTQRGRSGSFTQVHGLDDDAPVGGDASFLVLRGFALPRRAMELTRPYTQTGLA